MELDPSPYSSQPQPRAGWFQNTARRDCDSHWCTSTSSLTKPHSRVCSVAIHHHQRASPNATTPWESQVFKLDTNSE